MSFTFDAATLEKVRHAALIGDWQTAYQLVIDSVNGLR